MEEQWRNQKHRDQWRMTLTDYCGLIRAKKVSEIGVDDVLKVLKPIWTTKSETASRLRGRIERVLGYAKAKGWRQGENPATWRGNLANILPVRQKLTRGHHAAMSYDAVPGFILQLRESEGIAARALEFLILNASRSWEVLGARWDEIDRAAKVWTIPKERMKAGREHRVPLSDAAVEILNRLDNQRFGEHPYVFPGQMKKGQKEGRPLSNMSMAMLMRRLNFSDLTVHGFRSAFRDWAGDRTTFPREIAEAALAHAVGDETERAYRRGDALAKRRKLMEAWEKYLTTAKAGNVVQFGTR
jgi:integrase